MPVDPELRSIVDAANAAGAIDPAALEPAVLRSQSKAMAAAYGPVEDVHRVADRKIPGPGGAIPVRIYTPGAGGPYGVLVFFHGSGFVIYDLDSHDRECRALCNRAQAIVVSVDYRLAPEHRFPAATEDAWAALEWVATHARELGGDPARLAVGGDSAGGNLAAVTAQAARDRGGPPLRLQLLVYPVTDCRDEHPSQRENAQGYLLTRDMMLWFIAQYVRDDANRSDPRCSPLLAASFEGLAPALVITAEHDPLRDEGEAYARRLREAGVPTTLSRYEGAVHGFFQMSNLAKIGRRALDEAGSALREALA